MEGRFFGQGRSFHDTQGGGQSQGNPNSGNYDNSYTSAGFSGFQSYGEESDNGFQRKGRKGKKGGSYRGGEEHQSGAMFAHQPLAVQEQEPTQSKPIVNMDDEKWNNIRHLLNSLKQAGGFDASSNQDSSYAYSWQDTEYQQPWSNTDANPSTTVSGIESYQTSDYAQDPEEVSHMGPSSSYFDTAASVSIPSSSVGAGMLQGGFGNGNNLQSSVSGSGMHQRSFGNVSNLQSNVSGSGMHQHGFDNGNNLHSNASGSGLYQGSFDNNRNLQSSVSGSGMYQGSFNNSNLQSNVSGSGVMDYMPADDDYVFQTGAGTVAGYDPAKRGYSSGNQGYEPAGQVYESVRQTEFEPEMTDSALNKVLLERMEFLGSSLDYIKRAQSREKLSTFEIRQKIVETVNSSQSVVISGETGSGKSTQVPQYILDDYIQKGAGSQCSIICTQPRRITAISVAERVASERCEKVDYTGKNSVGYKTRLESKYPRPKGSILFCTTGAMLSLMEEDPILKRATHVIIDEVHERDMHTDFVMVILKDLVKIRPDLKVILLTVNVNPKMFTDYFDECPLLEVPGFPFPVKEYCLEDVLQMTKFKCDVRDSQAPQWTPPVRKKPAEVQLEEKYQFWCRNQIAIQDVQVATILQSYDFSYIHFDLILHLIKHIMKHSTDGAILVFLPSIEEIKQLRDMLKKCKRFKANTMVVIRLHSLMPALSHSQRETFERPPRGMRKVILATNIAETSITIDDIVYVIDCGKNWVKGFDPEMNLNTSALQWVSKASSKQRSYKAGRITSGHCFHLFTSFHYHTVLQEKEEAEMLGLRLEDLCLQIKLLKLGSIAPFLSKSLARPSTIAIQHAIDTLTDLHAFDENEELLPLGHLLAKIPYEPHIAKMILFGAMFGCLNPILTVAASLTYKDAFVVPAGYEVVSHQAKKALSIETKSDHITMMNAFEGWEQSMDSRCSADYCWKYFLSHDTLLHLYELKKHFADILYDMRFIETKNPKDRNANINSDNPSMLRAILCAGMYPNVAQVICVAMNNVAAGNQTVGMMLKDQSKVFVHPKSVNMMETFFESKWMIFNSKVKSNKVYIEDSTMVSPYPLFFFGGDIGTKMENGHEMVNVNDWMTFKAPFSTVNLVKDLRRKFDEILWEKIARPGITSWDRSTKEGVVMTAISDFITEEPAGCGQPEDGSIGIPYY